MTPHLAATSATTSTIFTFLRAALTEGKRGVLVTLIALTGSSSRSVGTHMAVLEDGSYAGSFSAGCVEAGIVAEALKLLADGRSATVRFGAGSPYIDLKLPCGGSIDLLFVPDPQPAFIEEATATLEARRPLTLAVDDDGDIRIASARDMQDPSVQHIRHAPPLRLILAGHGVESLATMRLAAAYGAEAMLLSPDEQMLRTIREQGFEARHLASAASPPPLDADRWTAILLLFHDHDWEIGLLARAVTTEAFWIGAMGSPRTHAARLIALKERGIGEEALQRIHGPVELLPSSRDPATLALSALAEIVGAYRHIPSNPPR